MKKQKVYIPVDVNEELPKVRKNSKNISEFVVGYDNDGETWEGFCFYDFRRKKWFGTDGEVLDIKKFLREVDRYVFTPEELKDFVEETRSAGVIDIQGNYPDAPTQEEYIKSLNL